MRRKNSVPSSMKGRNIASCAKPATAKPTRPGSSGMAARARLTRSRRDEERESLHGADADAVALAAAQRMEALKAAGHLGTPRDDIPTRSRWNLAPLAMLAVAAAWAVAGLLA